MRVLTVIPARYASSRYPGKPLAQLRGATGVAKSLLHRSWEAAEAAGLGRVVIATEDARIMEAAEAFGAEAVMTPDTCRNGTERCAAALEALGEAPDCVVNLQGDAPLTPPWFLGALVGAIEAGADVATPVLASSTEHADALRADRQQGRVGGTTAVTDRHGDALYFSKEVLPYGAAPLHHVGVYAYTPPALAAYLAWPPGDLELAEGLEQLRFVENRHPVACVRVEDRGRPFWELNNPEDVPRIEAMMARIGME